MEDNSRDDFDPAWSPSTGTIAFVTKRNGNDEIYSMDTIGHSLARLTSSPADDRQPAWSPDGKSIAFSSSRDGNSEIYVMSADGGAPRRLTDDPAADTNPSWSPDGKLLVFTRGSSLAVVSASGGATRPLTASGDRASWAPAVDLAVALRASRTIRATQTMHVRIALRGLIPFPASNVVVSGSVSVGAFVVRARSSAGSCSGTRTLRCALRSLDAARSVVVDVALRANRCGRIEVRVSIASLQPDLRPADNRAHTRLDVRC